MTEKKTTTKSKKPTVADLAKQNSDLRERLSHLEDHVVYNEYSPTSKKPSLLHRVDALEADVAAIRKYTPDGNAMMRYVKSSIETHEWNNPYGSGITYTELFIYMAVMAAVSVVTTMSILASNGII